MTFPVFKSILLSALLFSSAILAAQEDNTLTKLEQTRP
jgi:hypothetical protein